MPVLQQDQRPEVRVPPADRPGGVDHGGHALRHQTLGGDAVEVLVVDDGDLARLDPAQQVLGAPVDPAPRGRRSSCSALDSLSANELHLDMRWAEDTGTKT